MPEVHRRRVLKDLDPLSLKEVAGETLEEILNANRPALQAIRSYWHHRAVYDTGVNKALYAQLHDMDEEIRRMSDGVLHSGSGSLCQLSDTRLERSHNGVGFVDDRGKEAAVRGLWVMVIRGGFYLEGVIMDPGSSRAYFDHMTPEEKVAFPQGYIQHERKNNFPYFEEVVTPPFLALVGDKGNEYIVEQITSMRE